MKLFVFYRRKDSQPFADRIYDWLEREFEPDNAFKDIDTISLGRDFRRILQKEVARCDGLLVVIGPCWLGETDAADRRRVDDPEDRVRIEIETALERDIPVIPLLVGGASFPREEDLPPSLQKLVYRHGTLVRPDPDFRPDIGRVIKALRDEPASRHPERSAPVSETTAPSEKEAPPPPRPDFRHDMGRLTKALREIVPRVSRTTGEVTTPGGSAGDRPASSSHHGAMKTSKIIVTILEILFIFTLYFLFTFRPKERAEDAAAYTNRGTAWDARREYDKAIADKAIGLDPKEAVAYFNRGTAWSAKLEYDKAIADYDKAIRLDPKYAFAYNNRGNIWRAQGEYDKAIADYDKAIELDPKEAVAYLNRGNTWRARREYDKAIADYDKAIELDPKDAWAYNNRGLAWSARQEYDKAITDYDKAIELDPKEAVAYLNRGLAWSARQEYDKAIADYDKAIELDPKNAGAAAYFASLNRDLAPWSTQRRTGPPPELPAGFGLPLIAEYVQQGDRTRP